MAVGAFPIAKLAALAFRQLSKPLAKQIQVRAKNSPFFRTYVCMPPAQFYHWCEVNIKMRLLNLGKPSDVPKLRENAAIELGAELLGEAIIFSAAAVTLIAEYLRQQRNEKTKEDFKEDRFHKLSHDMEELQLVVTQQEAEIRHLTRVVSSRFPSMKPAPKRECSSGQKDSSDEVHLRSGSSYVDIDQAVSEVKSALGKDKSVDTPASSARNKTEPEK